MLKQCRQNIVNNLWQNYLAISPQMKLIDSALRQRGVQKLFLDHFAIIDLPGPNTGIYHLKQIFTMLGYIERGKDYLPEKQNDFLWMTENDHAQHLATDVLPQVVVADFRLDELPQEIKMIIEKYSRQAFPTPLFNIKKLTDFIATGDKVAEQVMNTICMRYFAGRDWPLPTVTEFQTVREFNELLAWVLVFGRRPNHFTLSAHLLGHFANLQEFHQFITNEIGLELNTTEGVIKGGDTFGIAQGSTLGVAQTVTLADGNVEIPGDFVEFVWRYPVDPECKKPALWDEFYTGFIARHANRVIESLFVE